MTGGGSWTQKKTAATDKYYEPKWFSKVAKDNTKSKTFQPCLMVSSCVPAYTARFVSQHLAFVQTHFLPLLLEFLSILWNKMTSYKLATLILLRKYSCVELKLWHGYVCECGLLSILFFSHFSSSQPKKKSSSRAMLQPHLNPTKRVACCKSRASWHQHQNSSGKLLGLDYGLSLNLEPLLLRHLPMSRPQKSYLSKILWDLGEDRSKNQVKLSCFCLFSDQ